MNRLIAAVALAFPLVAAAQSPATARPQDLDRGLAAFLPLDGDALDEVSGARLDAASARPAEDRNGRRGGALWFDGVRSRVNLGDRLDPARFTISAWILPDDVDRVQAIVSKIRNLPGHWQRNFELRLEAGGRLFLHVPGGAEWDAVVGTRPVSAGRWTHVAAVYDGARAQLYVDGVRDGAPLPARYAQSRTETLVGARPEMGGRDGRTPTGPGWFFQGSMDEVRVYDRPLADAEIALLASRAPPRPAPEAFPSPAPAAELVAQLPLDGDLRDVAGDMDGRPVGAPAPAEDRQGNPQGAVAFRGRDFADLGARVEAERFGIAVWLRPGRVDREMVILSKLSSAPGPRGWLELRLEKGGRLALALPGSGRPQLVRSVRPLSPNGWTHVAATFDGERASLYLDGEASGEAVLVPFAASRGAMFIGARPDPAGRPRAGTYLEGRLDDLRLYRGAPDARAIREIAIERGPGRPGPGQGGDDDGGDSVLLVRVGRLLVRYDQAVVRREAARIAEAEERILRELEQAEREARDARLPPPLLQRIHRTAGELQALRGRNDALSLDRKRSALFGLSEALWNDLAQELDDRPIY